MQGQSLHAVIATSRSRVIPVLAQYLLDELTGETVVLDSSGNDPAFAGDAIRFPSIVVFANPGGTFCEIMMNTSTITPPIPSGYKAWRAVNLIPN